MWLNELTLIEVPCLAKTQVRTLLAYFWLDTFAHLGHQRELRNGLTDLRSSYK
jgi:hypothetical protein